jgi:ferritin-like protein
MVACVCDGGQEEEARERKQMEEEDKKHEEAMSKKLKDARAALERKIKWLHKYG